MSLDELLLRLDFRDPDPEIIDLSPQGGVVSTLVESKIECLADEKVFPVTTIASPLLTLSSRMRICTIFFYDTQDARWCSYPPSMEYEE